MTVNPVFVALSAFGAEQVREHGQEHFLHLCADAGAAGVEIRRELFGAPPYPMPALRAAADERGLRLAYSTPFELFGADGSLLEALATLLGEADTLGAEFLKVSLGHFSPACGLGGLAGALANARTRLVVENDQTPHGGDPAALAAYMAAAEGAGIAAGLLFDIGNWAWTGVDPAVAAARLARFVRYVHCKAVAVRDGQRMAAPPAGGEPGWSALFGLFPRGVPRAVEYPLAGTDFPALTRAAIRQLAAF